MQISEQTLQEKAANIRLLVMDVDGVLTDGRLYFGNSGEELKAFSILDGLGIKLVMQHQVQTAIITGRKSALVNKRAENIGIQHVIQGREDKLVALQELLASLQIDIAQVAYIGDDLPDLSAINKAGLGIAVANAHHFVAAHADWQTSAKGGEGAVREICEIILAAKGVLDQVLKSYQH